MTRIWSVVFALLCLSVGEAQELTLARAPDTLGFRDLVFPRTGVLFVQPPMLSSLDLSDSMVVQNLPPGFLRSVMLLQPLAAQTNEPLRSMRLQWKPDDRWQPLFKALGYIQAGGAAYMTYRALKKYRYIR